MKIPAGTLCILSFLYLGNLYAQKLPGIQNQSKWLPANAKIDGRLIEWNDVLMAFQKGNHLEYTIANDSARLYLAFRSRDKTTTAKILAGGISMTLNASGKKIKNEGPEITFPVNDNSGYSRGEGGAVKVNFSVLTDSAAIVNAITKFKEIRLTNVPEIPDQTLSIYNEYGVRTKLSYSNSTLIGEYIIPLKLLEAAMPGRTFNYTIKLNGVPQPANTPIPPPPLSLPANRSPNSMLGMMIEIQSPTKFGGEYILANK